MPRKKIKGKIIRILDKRTVVINLGREQGIADESIFYILGDPEPVIDPTTNEVLGSVNVSKSRVRASQVFDKFTIATTKWTYISNPFGGAAVGNLFKAMTEEHDEGELNVNLQEVKPWKAKTQSPIEIGDEVEVTVDVPESSSAPKELTEANSTDAK